MRIFPHGTIKRVRRDEQMKMGDDAGGDDTVDRSIKISQILSSQDRDIVSFRDKSPIRIQQEEVATDKGSRR